MGKKRPGSKKHAPLPQKISNKVGGATTNTISSKSKKTTKPKPKVILTDKEKKDVISTSITSFINATATENQGGDSTMTFDKKASFDFGSLMESLDDSSMLKTSNHNALSVEVKGLKQSGPLNSKTTKHFNGKRRQQLERIEADQFARVASLPSFKANPLDAIREHLENQLK